MSMSSLSVQRQRRPTIGQLNYATNGAAAAARGGHMKRPSFAWLQPLHSPRKGLFTIVVIVGSFLVTWLPTSARIVMLVLKGEPPPVWLCRMSSLLLVTSFATNPMIYGLLNRAIRSEIIPAVFPPRNAAMKGLPRKNSQRRISMAAFTDASGRDPPPPASDFGIALSSPPPPLPFVGSATGLRRNSLDPDRVLPGNGVAAKPEGMPPAHPESGQLRTRRTSAPSFLAINNRTRIPPASSSSNVEAGSPRDTPPPKILITPPPECARERARFPSSSRRDGQEKKMASIGYSDSGIGDDMTCVSIQVECEDYCGSSVAGKAVKGATQHQKGRKYSIDEGIVIGLT